MGTGTRKFEELNHQELSFCLLPFLFFPLPFFRQMTMTVTIPFTEDFEEKFDSKEDLWVKNIKAHAIMRERIRKNKPYCYHCKNRLCADPTILHGDKALKKSKYHSSDRKFPFSFLLDC
jgi:hypothetical protein